MKRIFLKSLAVLLAFVGSAELASAKLVQQTVNYKQGKTELEGYLVYDDANTAAKPGVLVVHDWMGLTDKTKKKADELASLGYVAFAADIFGKGVRPANAEQAAAEAGKYRSGDRKLLRERAKAGLKALSDAKGVDKKKLAAIGFCFGGGTVLELARAGADVRGVVSFHGNLDTPKPDDTKNLKPAVLALHGADDPFVPAEQVTAFEAEMRKAKAQWELVKYGNAVHGFTDESAGNDNSKGQAYNPIAAKRAWNEMQDFFKEIL